MFLMAAMICGEEPANAGGRLYSVGPSPVTNLPGTAHRADQLWLSLVGVMVIPWSRAGFVVFVCGSQCLG
jgi:hypothetical protein